MEEGRHGRSKPRVNMVKLASLEARSQCTDGDYTTA